MMSTTEQPTRQRRFARHYSLAGMFLLALVAGISAGCADSASQQLEAARAKYLATSEPAGGQPFSEARSGLDAPREVVLVGRVGVPDQDPWVPGKAAFTIRDAADEETSGHGGEGHLADCPFCRRRASQPESMAIVQFVDPSGELVAIDARELFELAENQRVVVQGTAQLIDTGALLVSAHKLYVTR